MIGAQLAVGGSGEPLVVPDRTLLFRARAVPRFHDIPPDGTRFVPVTEGPRPDRLIVALDAPGIERRRISCSVRRRVSTVRRSSRLRRYRKTVERSLSPEQLVRSLPRI